MTPTQRLTILVILALTWPRSSFAKIIHSGDCNLSDDPDVADIETINICINGSAGSWYTHKSRTKENQQPDIRHHAEGEASLFLTPWLSTHTEGHVDVFVSRQTNKTTHRDAKSDAYHFQIGNNALSRHRINFGKGHPKFRIDHNQRRLINQSWKINSFETPLVDYVLYTYDNQLDWTLHTTYGRLVDSNLNERQRIFGATRIMYDISALEGTRLSLGGRGDGLLRRAVNIGIININGKGDETNLEITRSFSLFPYDPKEFKQVISLSYLSHMQDLTQAKFQYDDEFRHVRLGSLGGIYHFHEYAQVELQIGYAKYEDASAPSHWFTSLNLGAHL